MSIKSYRNIDEYIANFSESQQKVLKEIRATIKKIAPEAEEKIAYGIPTFKLNGKNLVHFAAYDTHYGLYPGPVPLSDFADQLKDYKTSKGTVQFPADKPIPLDLIKDIVKICVERNGGNK